MVVISMLYPNRTDSSFNRDYYLNIHMPQSIERLSAHPGYQGVIVAHGVGGATPGAEPAYVAVCHYFFDSLDDFLKAFEPHAALLQNDMPQYTASEPVIQISNVDILRLCADRSSDPHKTRGHLFG